MEKVSVIVPVYNIEKYLPRCIESIIAQTYKNIEIICIDDGSTDSSAEVVRSFMKKDERIIFISKENGGLSSARNAGIEKATGEKTVFVDGDDWIDTDTIENAMKYDADLILWGYTGEFCGKSVEKHIFDGDRILEKNFLQRRMIGLVGDELGELQNFDALTTAWGKMYRTDIIKNNNIRFVDTDIIGTEDALFNLYYTGFCENGYYINRPFNHYRKDNSASLTKTYKSRLFEQWQELYKRMDEYIRQNNCTEDYFEALNNRICWNIVGLGITELLNKDGMFAQIKNIKRFIGNEKYQTAYKKLPLKYFPLHWKLFFFCCRNEMSVCVHFLIKVMNYLIEN